MKRSWMSGLKLLLIISCIFFLSNDKVFALEDVYLINNNGISISEQEYNNLINLGFTDFQISNLDLDEFNANKNLEGQVVAETTDYYLDIYYYDRFGDLVAVDTEPLTEEEYTNYDPSELGIGLFGNVPGYIETTMKQLTTTITKVNNNFRYKTTLNWKSNPSRRSYDIIGIGVESSKAIPVGTKTFKQTYCTSSTNCTSSTSATINNQATGVGASFLLPTGTYTKMEAYLYFEVAKNTSSTVTRLEAAGTYRHATSSVTQYQSTLYNITGAGILLLDGIANKYDTMPLSVAVWTGTW